MEVDDKAHWLTAHPRGRNYDLGKYQGIIPLGVSPFVEYIPSLNARYWLKDGLPRVLTPNELSDFLSSPVTSESAMALNNVVEL
jgi:hypothetical protein